MNIVNTTSAKLRWLFLPILAVLIALADQGCKPLMYPFARAFGGPKESELKKIREAFVTLKTNVHGAAVVAYPPLVVRGGQHAWDEDAGTLLVEDLRRDLAPRAVPAAETPDVPFEAMEHNQYKYSWRRARSCASWVASRHPAGDYFVFTDLLTDESGELVYAAGCVIVDSSGQIAHAQLWNSHHYDPASFKGPGPFLEWMVRDLVKALSDDPLHRYPPYGVG